MVVASIPLLVQLPSGVRLEYAWFHVLPPSAVRRTRPESVAYTRLASWGATPRPMGLPAHPAPKRSVSQASCTLSKTGSQCRPESVVLATPDVAPIAARRGLRSPL